MAFRVKDLLINVLPGEGEDFGGGVLSRFPCHCGCTYGYTIGCGATMGGGNPHAFAMMLCPNNTMGCAPDLSFTGHLTPLLSLLCCPFFTVGVPLGEDPATSAQQLAELKSQLRDAIAQIEKHEKLVNKLAEPQSASEIEQLQAKLKEAHNELERRKSELKK